MHGGWPVLDALAQVEVEDAVGIGQHDTDEVEVRIYAPDASPDVSPDVSRNLAERATSLQEGSACH